MKTTTEFAKNARALRRRIRRMKANKDEPRGAGSVLSRLMCFEYLFRKGDRSEPMRMFLRTEGGANE